jgi:RimJ/RimL family protein N-acetyltransferase
VASDVGAKPLPEVELEPMTEADEWLTVAMETDPRVMAQLGGPWSEEASRAAHARRLRSVRDHGSWCLKILHGGDRTPVGSIMLWASEWAGTKLSEAGWMLLPEHHGKGLASAALHQLLDRARQDGSWGNIHAFPGATNEPSNALCRRLGFERLEEGEVDYGGRRFRVAHWVHRTA